MKKPIFNLFILGAVFGSILDGIHTQAGIASYTYPVVGKMAWWVPFIFGGGTLLIGWTHFKLHPQTGNIKINLAGSLFFFILAYLAMAWLKTGNLEKAGLLAGLYYLSWGVFDSTGKSLVLAAVTAIVGSGIESLLSYSGLYHYTHPDRWGMPIWLPLLYVHASAAVGNLGRMLLGRYQVPGSKVPGTYKTNVVEKR